MKVALFYTSIGSGHFSAAKAIYNAAYEKHPNWSLAWYDALPHSKNRSVLPDVLSALSLTAFPSFYNWSWQTGSLKWFFEFIRRLPFIQSKVFNLIEKDQPDAVICTHALPCAVLAGKQNRGYSFPLIAVSTDFQVHPYWPVTGIDAFAVASDEAVKTLIERGMQPERIIKTGIPIRQEPSRLQKAVAVAETKPAVGEPFHVLLIAGGRQIGPYLPVRPLVGKLLHSLAAKPLSGIHWTIIFGNDQAMYKKASVLLNGRKDITLKGFVENMSSYLSRADVVFTKPGGLALAESLSMGKPVFLLTRGAGQEAANASIVLESGAGMMASTLDMIYALLGQMLGEPETIKMLKLNARILGSPNAADQVVGIVEKCLGIK
jgi:processive 1,2-diacylglycerol beta-glucosyltransferase